MNSSKKIITVLISISVIGISLAFIFRNDISKAFVWTGYQFIKPPERNFCLNTNDDYRCVTDKALQEKNAEVCYFLDAGNSDRCIDEITIAADSPSMCEKIRQKGDREYCLKKFN
jgi:hypothetical protein